MRNTLLRAQTIAAALLLTIACCLASRIRAQDLHEDFSNGLPANDWRGTDTAWLVADGKLQSHWEQTKSSFYLGTVAVHTADSWQWWMKLGFNPSSQNYVDVFLVADTLNLLSPVVSGYFVRVGNTTDEVSLYHIVKGGPPVKIVDGLDGLLDHSSNTVQVSISRHGGHWYLQCATGAVPKWDTVRTAVDSSAGAQGYFGFAVKQSTASFFDKHYFDDITIGAWKDTTATPPDTTNPSPPDTTKTPPVTPPDTTNPSPPDTTKTPPVTPPDSTNPSPPDTTKTPPVTPPDSTNPSPPDTTKTPPVTPPDSTNPSPPDTTKTPPVTPPDTTNPSPPDTTKTPPVTPPDSTNPSPPDTTKTPPVTPPDSTNPSPPDTTKTPPVTPPDSTNPSPPDTTKTPPVTPPDSTNPSPPDTTKTPPVTPPDSTNPSPPDTTKTPPVTPPAKVAGRMPLLYDVVMHEILADPSPPVGLPPYRFVELRNRSGDTIQLQGCVLADATRRCVLPAYALPPDSLLIVCDKDADSSYRKLGATLSVPTFPAFKVEDTIVLRNVYGALLHVVAYSKATYQNDVYAKGGYSLEMIDAATPCSMAENWTASTARAGGTPGHVNAAAGHTTPIVPDLLQAFPEDSIHLLLSFSAAVDSAAAADLGHYHFRNGNIKATMATVRPPLCTEVQLTLKTPLQQDSLYLLSTSGIVDCNELESGVKNEVAIALTATPDSLEVVFNEVMYDPAPGMPQFIELYNRGGHAVDLSHVFLVMLDKDGMEKTPLRLSAKPVLLMAGAYAIVSNDPQALCRQSICGMDGPQITLHLPELSNAGAAMLLRYDSTALDAFAYSPDMQFGLLTGAKGISLERIDPDKPTQDAGNWHSAAADAGYSTPGRKNSQAMAAPGLARGWSVAPTTFSPDFDGMDDLATIHYAMPAPGFVGNISVFDANGRTVRELVRNSLLGTEGKFTWDGLSDGKAALPAGIYIIYVTVFDQGGTVQYWKQPLVLARKLQ